VAASVVSNPAGAAAVAVHVEGWDAAGVAVMLNPGKRIDVLPAAAGRLLVSVTVTVSPSVTINVGPGICMVLQNVVVVIADGANPTQSRPYTRSPTSRAPGRPAA
jgi:hypothetical protein